jgi:hypothetical protein
MKTPSIILLLCLYLSSTGCDFAPGSYPYAETYEVEVSESEVIEAIELFKEQNPEYIVPAQVGLPDGRRDASDHWYHVYFYYPKENEIVYMWARPIEKQKTTIGLIAINKGKELGNWKDINNDFAGSANNLQKQKFEERILSKIKNRLK